MVEGLTTAETSTNGAAHEAVVRDAALNEAIEPAAKRPRRARREADAGEDGGSVTDAVLSVIKEAGEPVTVAWLYEGVLKTHPETQLPAFRTLLVRLAKAGTIARAERGLYGLGRGKAAPKDKAKAKPKPAAKRPTKALADDFQAPESPAAGIRRWVAETEKKLAATKKLLADFEKFG